MTTQTPKQQAIIPDLPRQYPMVDKNGMVNDYWALFFDNLTSVLQNNYSPEGIQVPSQTAANIANLNATGSNPPTGVNTRLSNANILYDSTNDTFKGNINGTWKTFTLT